MLFADLIQHRTALGARQAIEGLIRMTPTRAHLLEGGQTREVEAASLIAGQRVRIRPGEIVPTDGEIILGATTMNEASITGESVPVDKEPGAQVFAGAVNLTGSIEVAVTRVGADTTLGQVRNLILDAEKTKIPLMRIIDQYIRWYTPVVIMVAFVTLFFTDKMDRAITVLLVTCPCAFVLATPTAMVAALSASARLGILVKDVGDLEAAGRLNAIAFDKTGTLTTGQLAVTRLAPAASVDPLRMLTLAAAAETHSNHPVAQAVVRVAKEAKIAVPEAADIHEEAGKGVSCRVNGSAVMIGRETWLKEEGVDFTGFNVDPKEMEGYSVLYISENKRVIGWIGLEDKARPEARKATAELRKLGIKRLTMFTGDRWSVAKRVALELGCTEVEAECLPDRKLSIVHKMFDENNTPGLISSSIVKVFEDSQGNLWVGTETGGVVLVDKEGKVTSVNIGRRAREGRLMAIGEDASGTIWLYTADGQLGRYRDGRLDVWTDNAPSNCRVLAIEDSGLVWVGTDTKLTAYGPFVAGATVGLPEAYVVSGPELGKLDYLLASKKGGCWRLANGQIQKCRGNEVESEWPYPWTNVVVSAACEDREGNLVVGTLGGGVFWFDATGKCAHLTREQGLSEMLIPALCVDREGCLWVGTDGGGLDRVKPRVFDVVEGTRGFLTQSVCEDGQNGLWFGISYDINAGAVGCLKDGVVKQFTGAQGLANLYVRSVFVDRKQRVWAGTWGGLFLLQQGQFLRVTESEAGYGQISAMYEDRQGTLWVGMQSGLARLDETGWKAYRTGDGLSANAVQAIVDDAEGNLWIGTAGGGLNRLRDGKFTWFTRTNGLPGDNVSSLCADGEGVLWVGTSGGLARFHGGKWTCYSKSQGLVSNSVGYLVEDGQGYLWIGSNAGLMRVPRKALNDFANHLTNSIPVRVYGKPDGLPTGECTFGSQPGAFRTQDGKLWFPTTKGLVSVNPANITPNTNPPPVIIESVFIDGQLQNTNSLRTAPPRAVTVPAGSEALEITYTSLNLSAPDKTSFRYRLEGYETAWTLVASYNRAAHYSQLPPNDYRFQVQACNEDGTWNRAGSMLAIKVLPPFWRTWWFLTLATGALLGLIVGSVYYVSTQKLQRQLESLRQKEALEKERARIARDIHDQVGASLTQVSLLGELVESDKDHPEEVEAHARQISQAALETTRALDQIVWTVNPSNDTLDGLITYICKYAQEYLAVAGLRYRLEVPEQLSNTPISPELRHNVFLASKEAVTNVVRHAHASAAWLRLRLEPHRFTLEIEDNGRGVAAMDEKKGRNGLRNMRKRMEDVGGEFSIGPGSEGGALVRLVVPLKDAGS